MCAPSHALAPRQRPKPAPVGAPVATPANSAGSRSAGHQRHTHCSGTDLQGHERTGGPFPLSGAARLVCRWGAEGARSLRVLVRSFVAFQTGSGALCILSTASESR